MTSLSGTLDIAFSISTSTFCKSWIEIGCVEDPKLRLLVGPESAEIAILR